MSINRLPHVNGSNGNGHHDDDAAPLTASALVQASKAIYDRLRKDLPGQVRDLEADLVGRLATLVGEQVKAHMAQLEATLKEQMEALGEQLQAEARRQAELRGLAYAQQFDAHRKNTGETLEGLKALLSAIPRAEVIVPADAVRPVINIETPRRKVTKRITYDEMGRPSTIEEREEEATDRSILDEAPPQPVLPLDTMTLDTSEE
jgi:hypothetical protein